MQHQQWWIARPSAENVGQILYDFLLNSRFRLYDFKKNPLLVIFALQRCLKTLPMATSTYSSLSFRLSASSRPILRPAGTPLIILISSEIHHSPPQVAKNWQAAALCDKAGFPPLWRVNQEVCWLLLRFSGYEEFARLRVERKHVGRRWSLHFNREKCNNS